MGLTLSKPPTCSSPFTPGLAFPSLELCSGSQGREMHPRCTDTLRGAAKLHRQPQGDEMMPPRLWLARKASWLSRFCGFRRRSGTIPADPPRGRRRSRKRSTRMYFPPRAPSSSRKPSSSCNLPRSFVSSCTQKQPKCWPRYRNRACCLRLPTGLDVNSGYCSLKGSSESCN